MKNQNDFDHSCIKKEKKNDDGKEEKEDGYLKVKRANLTTDPLTY